MGPGDDERGGAAGTWFLLGDRILDAEAPDPDTFIATAHRSHRWTQIQSHHPRLPADNADGRRFHRSVNTVMFVGAGFTPAPQSSRRPPPNRGTSPAQTFATIFSPYWSTNDLRGGSQSHPYEHRKRGTNLSLPYHCPTMTTQRVALVTGGNRGIGSEICRQHAATDVEVMLGARDSNMALEASVRPATTPSQIP